MQNLPNILSVCRVFCGPLVIFLIAQHSNLGLWLALAIMALSEISDLLDGHLARKLNVTSRFGKIIDPLADSLYRAMVFLAFLDAGWMPLWMVAIIISRDILVSYLRIFAQQNGITMAARMSGKIKAIVQGIAQMSTVALLVLFGATQDSSIDGVIYALLFGATAVTAWSAIDYLLGFLRIVDLEDSLDPTKG